MILDSEYIEIKQIVSEEPLQMRWSEKINCHLVTNTHNNKGTYKDGQFVASTYTVFMDMSHKNDLPETQLFRIRLTSNSGEFLGDFETQKVEYLNLRQRIKITV